MTGDPAQRLKYLGINVEMKDSKHKGTKAIHSRQQRQNGTKAVSASHQILGPLGTLDTVTR